MSHDESPQDLDARFRRIVDAEFGPHAESDQPESEPFNMTEAMDRVDPDEPDEPFVPPQPLPQPIAPGPFLASSLLMSFSVVVFLGALFGAHVKALLGWAAATFVLGMVVALRNLPKDPPDPDDDGARV
ncbi:hypothetical protein [Luteococcus sp. OSA5]|uniref:hypothetical protein n=1 Tax=Luteococcus sp. OSA5 TaxID=3401630 RepID=UPI003B438216